MAIEVCLSLPMDPQFIIVPIYWRNTYILFFFRLPHFSIYIPPAIFAYPSFHLPPHLHLPLYLYLPCNAANENNSKRGSAANKSLRFCLLIEKSPVNFAETEINRIKDDDKIKRQRNIDRHCPRPIPILCHLP